MKNKATLLLHSFDELISRLSNEETGMLLKAILDYDIRGKRTDFEDRALMFLYTQIINSLDTHKQHYEKVCSSRKKSAEKRWLASGKSEKNDEAMQMHANAYNININENTNENEKENINISVNENKNENSDGTQTHKKAYGDFNNVYLTDEEYQLVKDKLPDGERRLQSFSAYIAATGKSYLNHYPMLLNWNFYGNAQSGCHLPLKGALQNKKPPGERREPTFDVSEFKKKALNLKYVPPCEEE